ncbi:MAG: c-type cytochrome [Acidobacteria bacterium]|nr:c-type cytochrome [Acidobacteriota bacterium]
MTRILTPAALLVIAGVVTAGAQEVENPFSDSPDRRAGEASFRVHCSLCHGYDARGGGETNGPDLTTGRFRRTSTLAGLFNVIRNGVEGTAMLGIDPDAPDRTVWQIIHYLDTLTPNPADIDLPGDAEAGRALFTGRGNCSSCHMVNGRGGRLGPDLSRVAERRDPDELRADLPDPDAEVEPRWWSVTATVQSGAAVEGLRMSEDTFTLRLIDADERLWSFSKAELRSYDRRKASTMPSVRGTLSDSEVDDLIAYLFTLRKES